MENILANKQSGIRKNLFKNKRIKIKQVKENKETSRKQIQK